MTDYEKTTVYLDYQNARPSYIQTFLDKLVNWDFANENLG